MVMVVVGGVRGGNFDCEGVLVVVGVGGRGDRVFG